MNDFRPQNRHTDRPAALTADQIGALSFICGMMFMAILSLLFRGLGA